MQSLDASLKDFGEAVNFETSTVGMPSACRLRAVPPVERISIPSFAAREQNRQCQSYRRRDQGALDSHEEASNRDAGEKNGG